MYYVFNHKKSATFQLVDAVFRKFQIPPILLLVIVYRNEVPWSNPLRFYLTSPILLS